MSIQRCATGIAELDQILRGGIPEGNVVLLAGGSGMGKTTLAMEFLAHGAERGENGLFLSVTEPVQMLERNAREYLFMQPKFLEEGRIRLVDFRAVMQRMGLEDGAAYTLDDARALVDALEAIVKQYGVRRLVIDSVTAICQRLETQERIRDFVFRLGLVLSGGHCTTLLTSETPPRELQYSRFGVEEFIADGIIFLSEQERQSDLVRTLQVMKMRGTEHSRARFMMDLSEYGISLAPLLKRFAPEGSD
jgi:circadian clock protein KaiC